MVMQNMCFISTNKQPIMLIIGMPISNKLIVRIGPYSKVLPLDLLILPHT